VLALLCLSIRTDGQVLALLDGARREARTGAHRMNTSSSRSFVDFVFKVGGSPPLRSLPAAIRTPHDAAGALPCWSTPAAARPTTGSNAL